ncbi:hypothetical protein C8R45DRAFT_991694 [Mycena sanguinolenta]|nr:hypothetical protein C8R45DRAFT_991694 [Mycena sanguinolenta]
MDHVRTFLCMTISPFLRAKDPDLPFRAALLSCGVVGTLTVVSRALCRSNVVQAKAEVQTLVDGLAEFISTCPVRWLVHSLRAGLLEVLFNPEQREVLSPCLGDFLQNVILPATVYRSVLFQLHSSLLEVRDRDAGAIFRDGALLKLWEHVVELVERRAPMAEEFNTGASSVQRKCDYVECSELRPKQELKRCSGCLSAHYCSPMCQAEDWRLGEHRQRCNHHSLHRKKFSHIPSRDRSFLQALTYHEYLTRREEIGHHLRLFVQRNPREVPCMIFDFTTGACEIALVAVNSMRSQFGTEFDRLTGSRGDRHTKRFIKFSDGSQLHILPFSVDLRDEEI